MTDKENPLAYIQQYLKAPKGQYNNFGKYKYRSCEDILEGLKPVLKEKGCFVILSDTPVLVGERHYIKATAQLWSLDGVLCGEADAYAQEPSEKKGMDLSQITGTASSYARKYALNGLFAIDDTKDADTDQHAMQSNVDSKLNDRLARHNDALRRNYESVMAVKEALANENFDLAAEAFSEISEEDRQALALATTKGGIYTLEETKMFKDERWSEARKKYIQSQRDD